MEGLPGNPMVVPTRSLAASFHEDVLHPYQLRYAHIETQKPFTRSN
jgi:hypothetical protein